MPEDRSVSLNVTFKRPAVRSFVLMLHADHETIKGIAGDYKLCPKCRTPWPCLAYKVALEDQEIIDTLVDRLEGANSKKQSIYDKARHDRTQLRAQIRQLMNKYKHVQELHDAALKELDTLRLTITSQDKIIDGYDRTPSEQRASAAEASLALAKESQERWQRDALSAQAEAAVLKVEVLRLQRLVARNALRRP